MNKNLLRFFSEYQSALDSEDVGLLGQFYADEFSIVVGEVARTLRKADFLKIIPVRRAQMRALGLIRSELISAEPSDLGSGFTLVQTRWQMTVKSTEMTKSIEIKATYILNGQGDHPFIIFQLDHDDLADAIKGA